MKTNTIFFWLFWLLLVTPHLNAQTLSIAGYSIGPSLIEVDLNDFVIVKKLDILNAGFDAETIKWIRTDSNLLMPTVLLRVELPQDKNAIFFKYKEQVIFPFIKENKLLAEIAVNLFSPGTIEVYNQNALVDKIGVQAKPLKNVVRKKYIDNSCIPFQLELRGIKSDYASVGCKLERSGSFGNERPRLQVSLSSTNLKTLNNEDPPYTFYFKESSTAEALLNNTSTNKLEKIRLKVTLPEKMNRLKIAGGLGPYVYSNTNNTTAGVLSNKERSTISAMLYGKLELTESSSIKAFDAILADDVFFNNSGLYFSYDVARILDGQIIFGALLGLQGLHYRFARGYDTEFDAIYPQGFEITYNHPFGFKNQYLSYGMFLSTTQQIYRNIWLRFGAAVFYELNYIKWSKDTGNIDMWGVSVGFPIWKGF